VVRQDDIQDVLASAEAALARAIINSAELGANWAETNLKLEKVRTYCRQLRAALVELGRTESIVKLENARSCCRALRAVILELKPSASLPFRCLDTTCAISSSPRTTCWLPVLEGAIAAPSRLGTSSECVVGEPPPSTEPAIRRFNASFPAQVLGPRDLPGRPSLLRQTLDLLALILTYLLYFNIDVQVQILELPSVFP